MHEHTRIISRLSEVVDQFRHTTELLQVTLSELRADEATEQERVVKEQAAVAMGKQLVACYRGTYPLEIAVEQAILTLYWRTGNPVSVTGVSNLLFNFEREDKDEDSYDLRKDSWRFLSTYITQYCSEKTWERVSPYLFRCTKSFIERYKEPRDAKT